MSTMYGDNDSNWVSIATKWAALIKISTWFIQCCRSNPNLSYLRNNSLERAIAISTFTLYDIVLNFTILVLIITFINIFDFKHKLKNKYICSVENVMLKYIFLQLSTDRVNDLIVHPVANVTSYYWKKVLGQVNKYICI